MKKLLAVVVAVLCIGAFVPAASANTVTVMIDGIDPLEIGTLQLFHYEPDSTYGWPVDNDSGSFPPYQDFDVTVGSAITYPDYWNVDTLIEVQGTVDYARGIAFGATILDPVNALVDGTLVTLVSNDTFFGVNPDDDRNLAWGMASEPLTIYISAEWQGDNQIVTISAEPPIIPIPGTLLLLGSGLAGLLGLRRRS